MKKGQVSPDFLVTIIFLGIFALIIFGAYDQMQNESIQTIERLYAKDMADRVAESVNSVIMMGDGARKSITLTTTLHGGKDYNITLRPNAVLVRWSDFAYASRFATASLSAPEIPLEPGELYLRNIDGTIYVEKVE